MTRDNSIFKSNRYPEEPEGFHCGKHYVVVSPGNAIRFFLPKIRNGKVVIDPERASFTLRKKDMGLTQQELAKLIAELNRWRI